MHMLGVHCCVKYNDNKSLIHNSHFIKLQSFLNVNNCKEDLRIELLRNLMTGLWCFKLINPVVQHTNVLTYYQHQQRYTRNVVLHATLLFLDLIPLLQMLCTTFGAKGLGLQTYFKQPCIYCMRHYPITVASVKEQVDISLYGTYIMYFFLTSKPCISVCPLGQFGKVWIECGDWRERV